MIDFGLGLDLAPAATRKTTTVVETIPVVEETVTVRPVASQAAGYAMKAETAWGWQELRDYVIREIEKRHGPQVRNPKTEASIFKSFMSRWPEQAVAIARSAFDVHDGMWHNAPISVNRFCKASDPYFAQPLAERVK